MPYRALRRSCSLKPKGRGQVRPESGFFDGMENLLPVIKAALTNPPRSYAIRVVTSSCP